MSFTSDCTSFRKTFDIATVKMLRLPVTSFEMDMNAKFYAALSLSLCMVPDSLFVSMPFAISKLKKTAQTFSPVSLIVYLHSANHDADRRPLVAIKLLLCIFDSIFLIHSYGRKGILRVIIYFFVQRYFMQITEYSCVFFGSSSHCLSSTSPPVFMLSHPPGERT